jgi:hypothetical protein
MQRPRALPLLASAALLATLVFGASCALYSQDRCYVPDNEYALAHDLFVQTGSLDLVEKSLKDQEWETCKINEALYRLQKEFQVLPEGTPAPATPAAAN